MAYRWNEQSGRFIDERGRFVSDAAVRSVIDDLADAASERLAQAAQRLLDGELSLGAWQAEMQATIKLVHVSAAVIAHGGAEQMTAARWGAIGPVVKEQYEFLRDFAARIADGRQPLNGMLTARSRQYGQASRAQFERVRGRDQQQRGFLSERNVLHSGESCSQCKSESARGWVPTGSLVPVGQRICRGNCRCSVDYRQQPAEAAA